MWLSCLTWGCKQARPVASKALSVTAPVAPFFPSSTSPPIRKSLLIVAALQADTPKGGRVAPSKGALADVADFALLPHCYRLSGQVCRNRKSRWIWMLTSAATREANHSSSGPRIIRLAVKRRDAHRCAPTLFMTAPFHAFAASLAVARPADGYGLWLLLFVVVSTLIALGSQHSVTPSYWRAAENWLAGQALYDGTGRGFIYLPQSAVLFVPFAVLPPLFREIVWRFVTIGFFAWGLERLAAAGQQRSTKPLFSIATAITLPISFTCARNGQATLLIAGLLMAAVALATRKDWRGSAACLVLATAFKPITLPLLVLSAVVYRPIVGRLVLGVALLSILPWLTRSPSYVLAQFYGCREMFRGGCSRRHRGLFRAGL